MTIHLKAVHAMYDIIMLVVAMLICLQVDETGYRLMWDFHGLLYAVIGLTVIPAYHCCVVVHAVCQYITDEL